MDMIKNRLEKNLKKLRPWAERHQIEAYRVYDRDIPEYPFIVDIYKNYYLIHDRRDFIKDKDKDHLPHVIQALKTLFACNDEQIIFKQRQRQEGLNQYEKLGQENRSLIVQESQARFKVNLWDYLDTGLFLDHRPIRQTIYKKSAQKRFLNLFCYTGAVSVFAALGKATTTSVDMSQTYIKWAQENFELNALNLTDHQFIQADVIEWLRTQKPAPLYDMIFLDPPTFSNSKRMDGTFEVERDQEFLIESCMNLLAPQGVLYFSNNKRKFKLAENLLQKYLIRDITKESIPMDFHDQKIHCCFEIRSQGAAKF